MASSQLGCFVKVAAASYTGSLCNVHAGQTSAGTACQWHKIYSLFAKVEKVENVEKVEKQPNNAVR